MHTDSIDKKYRFVAVNPSKHRIAAFFMILIAGLFKLFLKDEAHTDDDGVVFLARDNAIVMTLNQYHVNCKYVGADARQLKGIELLTKRVIAWRKANPHKCKVADIDPGAEQRAVLEEDLGAC